MKKKISLVNSKWCFKIIIMMLFILSLSIGSAAANNLLGTEREQDKDHKNNYTAYDLVYDEGKKAFLYNNQEVGFFIDKMGENKYFFYTNPNGKLRLKTIRNNNGNISSIKTINDDEYNNLTNNSKVALNTACSEVYKDDSQSKDKLNEKKLTIIEAKSVINKYFEFISSDKKISQNNNIVEISDNELYSKLKAQIFNMETPGGVTQSFLIAGSEGRFGNSVEGYKVDKNIIIPLGGGFGSIGVKNYYLYDIDHDDEDELIYIYSFGSGINHTVLNCIDDGEIIESIIDFNIYSTYELELINNELVLKIGDKKLGIIKLLSKKGNKKVLILEQ